MIPDHVAEAFKHQAKACSILGSPFMAQLCTLFATREWPQSPITDRVFTWPGDLTAAADSVPLRLAGALHAIKINGNSLLSAVYPPNSASADDLWQAVTEVIVQEPDFIDDWINSAPQTNEVRRSAVLIAVGRLLAERFGLPIRTSELGASGGLNLHWDSYGLTVENQLFGPNEVMTLSPEWDGELPSSELPHVRSRAGVDLNPLNPRDPRDALRLQAYLWPDQPDRMERTKAAIRIANTAVEQGDAIDWLAGRLRHNSGELHMIYHTVAWQYFPKTVQDHGRAIIETAGALASEHAPLAWFGMENDGSGKGAALTLRLWPGDITLDLGRADFHGRWVQWNGNNTAQKGT
jgi:hypothetical protein